MTAPIATRKPAARKASVKAASVVVKLAFVRSTLRTHVYKTDAEGAAVPQLYVQQSAFPNDAPAHVLVTVSTA